MKGEIMELLQTARQLKEKQDKRCIASAEKAYTLATQSGDTTLIRDALLCLMSSSHCAFDYKAASDYATRALELINPKELPEQATTCWNVLGVYNDIAGNYLIAHDYFQKIIALLETRQDTTEAEKNILANAYHNTCRLFTHIHSAEEHQDYFEKAIALFQELNNTDGLARMWNIKASMLPPETPIKERLSVFLKAYAYLEKGEDRLGYAICMSNVGLCYSYLHEVDKGIAFIQRALAMLRERNHKPLQCIVLEHLAEAEQLRENYEVAIGYLEEAETILLTTGSKTHLNVVYREWATALAAMGRYKEAYEKLLLFQEESFAQVRFDRDSAVAEAKLKFELSEEKKRSELLQKKNEEIEHFNERLQQANEELNQFAYAASHDLKEPVRMVSNYMQLLEKSFQRQLTSEQREFIDYAVDGAKRMYSLIDSLLLFSRVTVDAELHTVDLNEVLDEVVRTITAGSTRPLEVTSEKLPQIYADTHQMLRVFQNLIANAVKYNDKERVRVEVSVVSSAKWHRITIADNGIGIEPQYRDRVFELFKRLHSKTDYPGNGIGLTICKKIIAQMEGRIEIEDSPLGGTAFVLTLPIA